MKLITEWPQPKNRKEMEAFLGFMNYHRDYIGQFADLAEPLYQMVRKKAVFKWDTEQQAAFEALKIGAAQDNLLAFPNEQDPFILDTDASDYAVAGVLIQVQSGTERPIAFASKSLKDEQRRYCTTRKELLAVITFTRQFRHYLLGRPFLVRTDHHSLVWLTRFKKPIGQLARWLEELSQYNMSIIHRSGKLHGNADGLSRMSDNMEHCECYRAGCNVVDLPCGGCAYCTRAHQQWSRFESEVDDVIPLAIRSTGVTGWWQEEFQECVGVDPIHKTPIFNVMDFCDQIVGLTDNLSKLSAPVPHNVNDPECGLLLVEPDVAIQIRSTDQAEETVPVLLSYSQEELKDSQEADKDLKTIRTWLRASEPPSTADLSLSSPICKALWSSRPQLTLVKDVLFYTWEEGPLTKNKLVVPESLINEILHMCHDVPTAGHLGITKTATKVKQSFYRPGLSNVIKLYVQSCTECTQNKKATINPRAGLRMFHAGTPMERVHIDVVGPLPRSDLGNTVILVIVDQFTKWVEFIPLPDQSTQNVCRAMLDNFFTKFGLPVTMHSDQGRNFESSLFQQLCKSMNITKTRTTPYRPSSNGQVERYNRILLAMICCYLDGKQKAWDDHLSVLGMAVRSMVNRNTGFTPNFMMLGREISVPDHLFGLAELTPTEVPAYLKQLLSQMQYSHDIARDHLKESQLRQKLQYDIQLKENVYEKGDLIYLIDTAAKVGQSSKLRPVYRGPYIVEEVLSPILYRLCSRKKSFVVHHDRMRACKDRNVPLWITRKRHELEPLMDQEPLVDQVDTPENTPSSDLDETVAYGETTPIADSIPDVREAPVEDIGIAWLFEGYTSRSGRKNTRPRHLDNYMPS